MEPKELSPLQCKECGWYSGSVGTTCSFCAALPAIRASLPDNFEQFIHMMPPKVPPMTYSRAVGLNPVFVPWGAVCIQETLFRTNIALSLWEYYFFKYLWAPSPKTDPRRSRCYDCAAGFRVIEQALFRQMSLNEEARQQESREAEETRKKEEAETVNVCRACNFPYFKLHRASLNKAHNDICSPSTPDSFNNLKLCGSCIDRLRTGPLFENFLQVMLDDAYGRDVIKRRGNT